MYACNGFAYMHIYSLRVRAASDPFSVTIHLFELQLGFPPPGSTYHGVDFRSFRYRPLLYRRDSFPCIAFPFNPIFLLSLPISLYLSLSLPISLYLSLSLFLPLSLFHSIFLFFSLFLTPSIPTSLSLTLAVSHLSNAHTAYYILVYNMYITIITYTPNVAYGRRRFRIFRRLIGRARRSLVDRKQAGRLRGDRKNDGKGIFRLALGTKGGRA